MQTFIVCTASNRLSILFFCQFPVKVIITGIDRLTADMISAHERTFTPEEKGAVHIRSIHVGPTHIYIFFRKIAVYDHIKCFSDMTRQILIGDQVLDSHDIIAAGFFHFLIDLIRERSRRSPFFLRIGKYTQTVEAYGPDKFEKLCMILFRLSGETGDQGRAKDNARNLFADV